MTVFVVIYLTGNDFDIEGAEAVASFFRKEDAEAYVASQATPDWFLVSEVPVQ